MKDRKKSNVWSRFFWCTIFVVFSCVIFTSFTFSTFRLLFGKSFNPVLVLTWRNPVMEAKSGNSPVPAITIRETVLLPDQALIFLNYPPSYCLFTKEELDCVYFSANSTRPQLKQPPLQIDYEPEQLNNQLVRCPLNQRRGVIVSLAFKSDGHILVGPTTHRWDSLVYDALVDRDNTTIMFVKGLNLRRERVSDAARFECVYGWDFRSPKFLLRSDVVSIAQEIVRCRTPLSILSGPQGVKDSLKVSVRMKGGRMIDSIARPGFKNKLDPKTRKEHEVCVCTMLRNQGRFIKEWVMYHARIGVQRWFVYDNNSEDDISDVIETLQSGNYNITRHVWPWIKTQEAGFAHCALRARDVCEWVGFIDVDEFFHLPSGLVLQDVLQEVVRNQSGSGLGNVGEVRVSCYSFGPSGLKHVPPRGVMVGYTCRLAAPERHKSIVRPEALNSTLMNVVHHFHLRNEFVFVDAEKGMLVINHYKYQVWEVFKEKFYRRVATYVADWQEDQNVGSKDRAPGLGTRAVEPQDWSDRFCEVRDMGLKNRVLGSFTDPHTLLLPWQDAKERSKKRRRRKGRHRGLLS
ncbi:glycosyltransferase family 92 protein [Quillaja saponaria]|uniref:Glycosyltransferase family 92 protein n=1 Tax=Quillaja saponaria TaxID=32244 RepID=A0AAD7M703_QUISA|nr:glycosyltransferase family 92 protein [Quillaja saponaria]